jgi:hypothetical protein
MTCFRIDQAERCHFAGCQLDQASSEAQEVVALEAEIFEPDTCDIFVGNPFRQTMIGRPDATDANLAVVDVDPQLLGTGPRPGS